MRLLLLGNLDSIHLLRWAKGFSKRGHQVALASCHELRQEVATEFEIIGLSFPTPIGYLLNAPALQRAVMQYQPDLLHAHFASGYGALGLLSGFRPRVSSVWGSDIFEFPQRSLLHRWLMRLILSRSDLVTSTSEVMAKEASGFTNSKVEVVPFGIDTEVFRPTDAGREPGELTIGTARNLRARYGLDLLLLAFARLQSKAESRNQRLRLWIIGDGPERSNLEAMAISLGVQESVEFHGAVNHDLMPDYLNRIDVFVMPSRRESFGVSALEASACAIPVVATRVGGLPEVVVDGVTGLLCHPEDPEDLAKKIDMLIWNSSMRRRLGESGRRFVVDHYEWSDCVDHMVELYLKLIDKQAQ